VTPFFQFLIAIIIIIACAKIGGYVSLKLGFPSVLGELTVGILLGPSVFDLFHSPLFSDEHLLEGIAHLAELGVIMLMFIAGLDLHLTDLAKSFKVSALAGTLGVLLPLTMGYGFTRAFSFDEQAAIFTGLILAATSVSISAQTLMEMKVLRSRVGISLLGAAVFDDVLVVLGLSIFVALVIGAGTTWNVVWIFLRMLIFVGIATSIGWVFLPKVSQKVDDLPISQGLLAFVLIGTLFYAWAAEVLGGMAAITGAFLAGLLFARSPSKDRIEAGMSSLAFSIFVPIFFVNVGLVANIRLLTGDNLWLVLGMILVAIISKVLGSGIGARLAGLTNLESLQLGAGMTSRGEVGLIVANVGIVEGLIGPDIFATVVGVVIATTLLTPAMLRILFTRSKATD